MNDLSALKAGIKNFDSILKNNNNKINNHSALNQTTTITYYFIETNLKWLIPAASLGLLVLMVLMTAAFFKLWKICNNQLKNTKDWSSFGDETTSQNYGSCEKLGNFDQPTKSKNSKCLKLTNSFTWPNNLFGKTLTNNKKISKKQLSTDHQETSKLTKLKKSKKNKSEEDFQMKSMMSVSTTTTASSSQTSLNSLSAIISNENLCKISAQQLSNLIVNYSVRLNEDTKSLQLNVISLENINLPASLIKSKTELSVYIKIEIISQSKLDANKRVNVVKTAKTRMIKSRTNPVFDETFEFDDFKFLFASDLDSDFDQNEIKLVFNVCNTNLFGRDQLVGQHVHFLSRKDFLKFEEQSNESNLRSEYLCRIFSQKADLLDSRANELGNLGQLNLTLLYNNTSKTLHIHILKASNLQMPQIYTNKEKIPNAFVKIYLLYRGQRVDKKQTKVCQETRDPIFDEQFEFNLESLLQISHENQNFADEKESSEKTKELSSKIASRIQLFILLMDWDQVEKSDVIGKVELCTQHHQQRLINYQHSNKTSESFKQALKQQPQQQKNQRQDEESLLSKRASIESQLILPNYSSQQQNWYDIFYRPNLPIWCTFQIKNY